jgi:uncharacterized protein
MQVLVARFDLRIPGCRSLKEKRGIVKTLTNALRARFSLSVAEVDHHDLWQRTAIGVATVGPDGHHLRRVIHEVEKLVERWGEVELIETEVHEVGLDD